MDEKGFASRYDVRTSTLELSGTIHHDALPRIRDEVDRAFRRTACLLTLDLSRVEEVPAHTMGRLVHLCNTNYPGTLLRLPRHPQATAIA